MGTTRRYLGSGCCLTLGPRCGANVRWSSKTNWTHIPNQASSRRNSGPFWTIPSSSASARGPKAQNWIESLTGNDKAEFVTLLRSMMKVDPDDRQTAKELLGEAWVTVQHPTR
ncbi:uncharacterized protein N7479_005252 [Penicillium vulpinum]|uniref:uncharacterized protein n=1 Tax=Penicillium vulpinum TaxID=29845 RepID=UPI002548D5A8|nr:uncharacterized protein N7479_005252 [Penicillium vulpinum]KAJ5958102.1 hypothetical protein N7479_005252 [Penicillium vulpinum]